MDIKITRGAMLKYLKIIAKSLIEFLPVFIFLVVFELTENFYTSTFVLIVSTISFTFYTFHKEKRLPYIALFIALETTFFGSLTLILKDPMYVQMRDTFYDLILGLTILITGALRTPIIKKFFGHLFDLSIEVWIQLSYAWGSLMLTFAFANEYVRRNFPEHIWINYKMTAIIITVLFGLFLLWKYRREVKTDNLF